jgi:hypothetical protein
MELLRWKTRISIMWIIEAVGMSVYMFLVFLTKGIIQQIMAGNFGDMQINEGLRFFLAIFWWIPFVMAFLTLTLKDRATRWTNFILGILFAIFCVFGLTQSVIKGLPAAIDVDYFIGVVFAALIAWYAWKWPKQAE